MSSIHSSEMCNESCYTAKNGNDGIFDNPSLIVKTMKQEVPYWEVKLSGECVIYGMYLFSGDPDDGNM